jgi:hypothetical protein
VTTNPGAEGDGVLGDRQRLQGAQTEGRPRGYLGAGPRTRNAEGAQLPWTKRRRVGQAR